MPYGIALQKGQMWSKLEQQLGRGILLMALDGLEEKL